MKVLKSGLSVFLEYRNSFLPTEQAKNVASTVDKIFSNIAASPKARLSQVHCLSDRNKLQLDKWNSEPLRPVERTIHDTIYGTVQRLPDSEAICSWDGSMTYQELDAQACRLASHLVTELDVGPESVMLLCFDKSKWNIVAMVAVLMAGGACKLYRCPCLRNPPDAPRCAHLVVQANSISLTS